MQEKEESAPCIVTITEKDAGFIIRVYEVENHNLLCESYKMGYLKAEAAIRELMNKASSFETLPEEELPPVSIVKMLNDVGFTIIKAVTHKNTSLLKSLVYQQPQQKEYLVDNDDCFFPDRNYAFEDDDGDEYYLILASLREVR